MIIFLILSLIIIGYSFYDFKKSFLLYLAIKMVALGAMCIRYESPALSMETLLNFYFFFMFFRKGHFRNVITKYKSFPLRIFFTLSLISILLSSIFSIMPLGTFMNGLVITILDDFVLAFIFWFYITKTSDIFLFLKYCILISLIICAFGIYEYLIQANVFIEFLKNNISEELLLGKLYDTGERMGTRRVQSLFVSPNNFIYQAFIALLVFFYNKYTKYKIKYSIPISLLFLLLILLANSRTVLIAAIVTVFPLLTDLKVSQNRKLFFILLLSGIILSPFVANYLVNLTSVIDASESASIEGSSVTGRMVQFEGSFKLLMRSPLIGNGINSISYFVSDKGGYRWIILGTESIWMKLMIERGIIGIIAYLFLFIELNIRFKPLKDRYLLFAILGYLVAHTMSSLPGFSVSFFYITVFCIYRIKTNKANESRNYHHTQDT